MVTVRHKVGQRPRIRVKGMLVGGDTATLVAQSGKTSFFRSPYVVGEMAAPNEDVEIILHADGSIYLDSERWPPLTPYDTGERLQPQVWVTPDPRRPEEHDRDRYGKVDFDDDSSTSILNVWVERKDGKFTVNIQPMGDDEISVVVHDSE